MENLGFKGSLGVQLTCLNELVAKKIKIQQPWPYEQYFQFKEPYFFPKGEFVLQNLMEPKRPASKQTLSLPEGTELTKETIQTLNQRVSEIGISKTSCAIHVKVNGTETCPSKYAEACLAFDSMQTEKMDYVVFGKDRFWCEKFLGCEGGGPYRFVTPHLNDLIDLFTISTFPYQVIDTQSAFGLWAAAMNTKTKKQIFLAAKLGRSHF